MQIMSLCSSVNGRDQISHQNERGRIVVIYMYINLYALRADGKTKYSEQNDSKHSPNLTFSQFLHECNFYLLISLLNI
jgi:hypothetical protein